MESIRGLHRVLEKIRHSIAHDIAITQLAIFLTVCHREGITMTQLGNVLSMPPGSVSRNVKILSRYLIENEDETREVRGYDLVRTEPALDDRRKMAVYLTGKGRRLRDSIQAWLREEEEARERRRRHV